MTTNKAKNKKGVYEPISNAIFHTTGVIVFNEEFSELTEEVKGSYIRPYRLAI